MLVVQLVEVFLQFCELAGQIGLVLDVRLHLFVLRRHALLIEALLSIELLDLSLLIFVDLLCLSELF